MFGHQPPAAAESADTAGVVAGVVYDSLLAGGPLAGAEVWVDGTAATARTDAAGRFRLSSVPPGRRRVTFFHAAFEGAGLGAPVRAVDVPAGGTVRLVLATPSPATARAALCGPGEGGVLVGLVRAAGGASRGEVAVGGRAGARGAEPLGAPAVVVARWRTLGVAGGAVASIAERREARAGEDGAFRICGLPREGRFSLVATGGRAVGVAGSSLGGREFGTVNVVLPSPPSEDSAAPTAVIGEARTAGGTPARVYVTLGRGASAPAEDSAATRAGYRGVFRIAVPGAGSYALRARGIGLVPVDALVDLPARGPVAVLVTLDSAGVPLAPVGVTAPAARDDPTGFDMRRRAGLGTFVDRAEVLARRPLKSGDLLYGRAGIRVNLDGSVRMHRIGAGPLVAASRICYPAFYLDGQFLDTQRQPQPWPPWQEIRGIEAYNALGTIPPQYAGNDAGCGVILVWTVRGRDRR